MTDKKSLLSICVIEITSASIANMLTAINASGIHLRHIFYLDDLHIRAEIYEYEFSKLQLCLSSRGDEIKILDRKGSLQIFNRIKRRPVLIIGILFILFLTLYLPTRIFFICVEGNKDIPAQLIVEKAENCGIKFGALRREIRSEKIKNALLSQVPQLQWAGVNTAGCVAVISVRERTEEIAENGSFLTGNIVAARDGVISDLTVLQGNPLCKIGQAVKKGQVLVSGYTDCGLVIKVASPEAEIKALTQHKVSAVTPNEYLIRSAETSETRQYLLRLGKNIINFCKYSGISDTRCVKMYEETYMVLPGGFQLPVSVITERTIYYETDITTANNLLDFCWMETAADKYVQMQMNSGEILNSSKAPELSDDLFYLNGAYACSEIISEIREEEFVVHNGKAS